MGREKKRLFSNNSTGTPMEFVLTILQVDDTNNHNQALEGYSGEIMRIIRRWGNFTLHLQDPEEVAGAYNSTTKKWNGIMEKLINNKTDIGLAQFSMSNKRYEYVDFSIPIGLTQAKFYIKLPNDTIQQISTIRNVILILNIFLRIF